MPYIIKATWVFGGVEHGWQEQIYFEQSSPNLTAAIAIVDAVAQKRKELLGTEYFIKATKVKLVSNEVGVIQNGGSRISRVRRVPTAANSGAQVDECLMVSFYPDDGTRRKTLYLGGIWDGIEVNGGVFTDAPTGWLSAWNAWKLAMQTELGIVTTTPSGPACSGWLRSLRGVKNPVVSYVSDSANYVTIQTAIASWTEPPGTQLTVRLAKMAGLSKSVLNGLQAVQVIDTTHIKLLRPIACAASVPNIGNVTRYTYTLQKAPVINPEEIRTHERGRPLLVSPGRRGNRART